MGWDRSHLLNQKRKMEIEMQWLYSCSALTTRQSTANNSTTACPPATRCLTVCQPTSSSPQAPATSPANSPQLYSLLLDVPRCGTIACLIQATCPGSAPLNGHPTKALVSYNSISAGTRWFFYHLLLTEWRGWIQEQNNTTMQLFITMHVQAKAALMLCDQCTSLKILFIKKVTVQKQTYAKKPTIF